MSRRGDGNSLFIGRLSKSTRVRDLENIFEPYGRITRCEIKYGAEMAYGFIDFEDRRDAEDAIRFENGREICGSSVIVERVKGAPRRPVVSRGSYNDECYRCHRSGHFARDCHDDRYSGYRRSRGGRYRSPSPRRRRRSRSRSRGKRRRSRSRSGRRSPDRNSRRSRSRSRSQERKRSRRSRSESRSKSKSVSRSRSKSPSPGPTYKSHSRSPSPQQAANGDTVRENSKSRSRSRSRSKSANSDD